MGNRQENHQENPIGKFSNKPVSRRTLLRGAAVGASGLVIASLVGCSPEDSSSSEEPNSTPQVNLENPPITQPPGNETPPNPNTVPENWKTFYGGDMFEISFPEDWELGTYTGDFTEASFSHPDEEAGFHPVFKIKYEEFGVTHTDINDITDTMKSRIVYDYSTEEEDISVVYPSREINGVPTAEIGYLDPDIQFQTRKFVTYVFLTADRHYWSIELQAPEEDFQNNVDIFETMISSFKPFK